MYSESILIAVLLVQGRCDEASVARDIKTLGDIFLNDVVFDDDDGCDALVGSIDDCVDCYPCDHAKIKGKLDLEEIMIRKSNDCSVEGYLKLCCIPAESSSITIKDRLSDPTMCGLRKPEGVGNRPQIKSNDHQQNTAFGEFPWVVAVLSKCREEYNFRCMGTLINSRAVLTSVHCCLVQQTNCKLRVRAGEWQFSSNDTDFPHKETDVLEVVKHEKFDDVTFENNIALLILTSRIDVGPHIGFACLGSHSAPGAESECYVAGWGVPAGSKDKHRDIMRYIKMSLLSRDECERQLRHSEKDLHLGRTYMCARGDNGQHTRKADGGAALFCAVEGEKNRFVQHGIVTIAQTIGLTNVPNLFTDVTVFNSWIDQKVEEKLSDDKSLVKDPYLM